MKWIYLIVLFALTSCNTSYFTSANNMRNIMGKIILKNGTEKEGEISVNNEGGLNSREYIRFKEKGGKEEKIPFQDFEELIIRNEFYTPKKIDDGGLFSNNNKLYLVKRLTKANSRIQFYEYLKIRQNNNTTTNGTINTNENRTLQYYISLASMDKYETYNIEKRFVVPNFEDKVSEIVKDCTTLSEKIKRKEKGYFYAQVSLNADKRVDTWMRIIEEYNECK